MICSVIESKRDHIPYVAENLRNADLDELAATGTVDPYKALTNGFEMSKPSCYTFVMNDLPVSMFGVAPFEWQPNSGSIWMLGTNDVTDKCSFHFLRWSKRFLPKLLEPYDMVCNIVDARNTVHIEWIKWLGFKFLRPIKFGPQNLTFWEFAETADV
tara:strand:+ start:1170 stop:1640 length:471 start_codon:yes stop_codon:yes gene_type:complete